MRPAPATRLALMLRATARTVPSPVFAIACLAPIPAFVSVARGADDFSGALTASSVIAGAGAGFAADDPAAPTLSSSPTTLRARRTLRATCAVFVLLAGWTLALVTASWQGRTAPDLLVLGAELGATGGVAAAFASRARTDAPVDVGVAAASFALLTVLTVSALATRWPALPTLWSTPSPGPWWVIAGAGTALAGWSSRDPASRSA